MGANFVENHVADIQAHHRIEHPRDSTAVVVRVAEPKDAGRIRQVMLATGLGPGTGIAQETFLATMTIENILASMDRMKWLLWSGGLFLVIPVDATTCEVHIAVLADYTGDPAFNATETAMAMIFTRTPCTLLVGRTPLENRAACFFAVMAGFRRLKVRGVSQIGALSFFDWLASRDDPGRALMECAQHGQGKKANRSRAILEWITRGEVENKVEV